jgi:hypothetical protein
LSILGGRQNAAAACFSQNYTLSLAQRWCIFLD